MSLSGASSIVPLQSVGRLRTLSLYQPLPALGAVFTEPPCTRISELRICAEAPGGPKNYNDPILPITIPGAGDLVLIELDSLLAGRFDVPQRPRPKAFQSMQARLAQK